MTTLIAKPEKTVSLSITAGSIVLSSLVLLTLLGVLAGLARLVLGLGATTGLNDGYSWGIWIGFDFVLIAFSGAGFTMAAIAHVLRLHRFEPAVRPAILAGLMGYTTVLVLLLLDLGRPDRFYHFLLYWNLHSPLFEISLCILFYSTVLAIETAPFLLERLKWPKLVRFLQKFMMVVAITGVTLSSLHQSTLGTLYLNMPHRLDPLWYSPALPLLFFVSSIMAGLSMAMLAYYVAASILGQKVKAEVLHGLAAGAAWVTLLYILLKLGEFAVAGELPALFSFDSMSQLMWLELGLGAVAPFLLWLIPAIRRHRMGQWLTPGLILFGVLFNRFSATLLAQTPPAGTPPYSAHILEWLSTLGIIAGAALAWYIAVRWLVIFEDTGKAGRHA